MEGAGRTVDDEELREAMKENGIGRPSTRAAIIETLFKRRYIKRRGKSIIPTQAGIDLIATIREPLLKSAKLTGIWENKLRRIERGDYQAADFIAELKQMVSDTVLAVLADNTPVSSSPGRLTWPPAWRPMQEPRAPRQIRQPGALRRPDPKPSVHPASPSMSR